MKVILTVHQFFPEFGAGTEVLTYSVAKELQRLGHTVKVFTGSPAKEDLPISERFDKYTYDGIEVYRYNHIYERMPDQKLLMELDYNNQLVYMYFKKLLAEEKPDIVHIFHLIRLSASIIDACTDSGVPVVMTPTDFWLKCITCQLRLPDNSICAGPDRDSANCVRHIVQQNLPTIYEGPFKKVPKWMLSLAIFFIKRGLNVDRKFSGELRALVNRKEFLEKRMKRLDQLFIPTKIMQQVLLKDGSKTSKNMLIPFGINMDNMTTIPKHRPGKKLVLGYIGTISEHKGVHIVAAAVHRLANRNVELRIYGKQDDFLPYFEELQTLIGDDDRIKFHGTFPNHEIGKIMSSLDALVVPSIWYENTPLVVYSAQAAGCPVLGSNMPGIAEVIHDGVNGFLFEPGNVSSLVMVLQKILHGNGILEKLRLNAVKPLSVQGYVAQLVNSYDDIVKNRINP